MKKIPEFVGFSQETIDFLWGIRFNNNRDWFAAHKEQYQKALLEPMRALAEALKPDFAQVEGMQAHVSRIYRDMRMHPPTFYKDSLWLCFQRKSSGSTLENPCLCFEVRPEGYRYGFLLWCARVQQMNELRIKIADHADAFLRMVQKAERESGVLLDGIRYAKPKPCADERLSAYFRLKNFSAIKDSPPNELLYSPALLDEVRRVLTAWLPMEEFCRVPSAPSQENRVK